VHGIVSQVALSTTRLGAASEELTTVMGATSENIQREKQDIDLIATAITEMNATVHEVASHSSSAAESAQDSATEAEEGKRVVDGAIGVIERLASEIEQAANVIQKLDIESKNIGGVLDVITGIAEQTNLLALNAAIEAARAGEQGRGFAVVADEVRTLAARTQQSTLEIQDMISRLQTEVNNAVQAMETSRSMAQTGVDQAGTAGSSLERIAQAVISIREKNSEIAHATEQQSTVAEEINQKIISISQLGEQNADGSQGAANSSSELAMLAMELQALVGQFKT
jgi:methyl-accepting chemotaxis protein